MKKGFIGTDGTAGFVYSWDSTNKNVGAGEQEITGITEGERVNYGIRFIRPFRGVSNAWIAMEAMSTNQTKVDWVFKGVRNYPMKLLHGVLNLKKVLGKDLQTSLDNLKEIMEKQA
ncbi:MAG: SRPBCC family protein [Chitinophagales bacterium]